MANIKLEISVTFAAMSFKNVIISSVYTCFVLLNVVPVDACSMPDDEMACCPTSCCSDSALDCCVIDAEDNAHATDHSMASPLKWQVLLVNMPRPTSFKNLVLVRSINNQLVFLERPPPKTTKVYIALKRLILYA